MNVNCFSKDDKGEWQSAIYNKVTDLVSLNKLGIELQLQGIYKLQ